LFSIYVGTLILEPPGLYAQVASYPLSQNQMRLGFYNRGS